MTDAAAKDENAITTGESPAETTPDTETAAADTTATDAGKSRLRSTLLAAGIGFAAGAGLLLGTLGALGVGDLFASPRPAHTLSTQAKEETLALKHTVSKLEAQVADLKASVDASRRLAEKQRARTAEREKRNARAQSDMQTRLAKIGDSIERLEKRPATAAAPETTGSVAPSYVAAAAASAPPPAAQDKTPPKPRAATGWVIRDVFRGRALVASRRGVFEAAPGLRLPGLGRVEAVSWQNGHWVVVTERGIITAAQRGRVAYDRY